MLSNNELKRRMKQKQNQQIQVIENFSAFKQAEKKYHYYYSKQTDFSNLIDINSQKFDISNYPNIQVENLQECKIYKFLDVQGSYLIKNYLNAREQIQFAGSFLNTYCKEPFRTNISNICQKNQNNIVKDPNNYCFNHDIRWSNIGYQYDWTNRCYPDQEVTVSEELNQLCEKIKCFWVKKFPKISCYRPESTLINYYQVKDQMGGHLDDGEIDQESPIFSFQVGLSCVFLLGGKTKDQKPLEIKLDSGDLLIMSGESRISYHGVPRIIENSFDDTLFKDQIVNQEIKNTQNGQFINNDFHILNYLRQNRINFNFRQVFMQN